MWSNIALLCLTLFSIWLVLFAAPCLSENLKCYICHSNKTWDECEKKKILIECLYDHDDVCIKMQYIENDDTEKGFNQVFVKMCGRATLCTNKECRYKYKTCHIDCCHNDLCNGTTGRPHVTSTLLATVLAVFLCLLQLRCTF